MISVVVVTHNSEALVAGLLKSLLAQSDQRFDLIVVDNQSADRSVDVVREIYPAAKIICNDENRGFGAACNIGIEYAQGEWIATLNPDLVLDRHFMAMAHQAIRSAPSDLGMLQSTMFFAESGLINSTGIELTRTGGARDRSFRKAASRELDAADVFCPTAGAALYRRVMLDQVRVTSGIFDEHMFLYWEDVDLGWRCRLAGWTAWYRPELVVHHAYQGSVSSLGPGFVRRQMGINRLCSLAKNASGWFLLRCLPRTVWDMIRVIRQYGTRVIPDFLTAFRTGWAQRAEVGALLDTSRRSVEKAWVGR